MAQPVEYENTSYNADDGQQVGNSATGKIGFYGKVPIVKPTVSGSVSTGAAVSSIAVALAALGLVTNSLAG